MPAEAHRARHHHLFALVLLLAGMLLAGGVRATTYVQIRAGEHEGFGRIVFDWPGPVTYETRLEGNRLQIRFSEPFEGSFAAVRRHLGRYVRTIESVEDGSVVEINLALPVRAKSGRSGASVVFDLYPSKSTVSDANLASGAPRTVSARFGDHPNFTRVVFDWRGAVDYRVESSQGEVTIIFDSPASIGDASLRSREPRLIKAMATRIQNGETWVTMTTPRHIRVRHFRYGPKVVVDVFEDAAAAAREVAEARRPKTAENEVVKAGSESRRWPEVASTGATEAKPEARAADEGAAAKASEAETTPAPSPKGKTVPKPPPPAAAAPAAPADTAPSSVPAKPEDVEPSRLAADGPPTSILPSKREAVPQPGDPEEEISSQVAARDGDDEAAPPEKSAEPDQRAAAAELERAPLAVATAEPKRGPVSLKKRTAAGDDVLEIRMSESGGETVFEFVWPAPVPAAAFERAGYLWIVFDRHVEAGLMGLGGGEGTVLLAQQIPHYEATVLRLKLRDGLFATLARHRTNWQLRTSPDGGGPLSGIVVLSQPDEERGPRIFLPVVDTGRRIEIHDPEVGDSLVVVPVLPSGFGVALPREYAEFVILTSLQGVAIKPRIDDLKVTPLRNGVAIETEAGLVLSSREVAKKARGTTDLSASNYELLLAVARWRKPGKDFQQEKRALQMVVARAPESGRNAARWELAKLFFARGFIADARAVLLLMYEHDQSIEQDPTFRAMRGVSAILAHRTEEAAADLLQDDLLQADLYRYPDVRLWRASVLVAQERMTEANQAFTAAVTTLWSMPEAWRLRFLFDWAEAAAAVRDESNLMTIEELLVDVSIPESRLGQLEFLKGRAAEFRQEPDVALESYEKVIASGGRRARLRAAVARANLKLENESIDRDQAIEELERQSHTWRGDKYENEFLRRLAELRLEAKDYVNALALMRRIVSEFPDRPESRAVAQRMNQVFAELFLGDGADELSPVKALALYYEYRELTPVGKQGDEMIRHLTDRLVQIDLLDRAASLLGHQVKYRLKGAERARIATRLALIHLLDKQPQEAVDVLDRSRVEDLDESLQTERRHLRARALTDLDRSDEALGLLEGDLNRGAELLRTEIAWGGQQWSEVATILNRPLERRWEASGPLSEEETANVLKLAVALYMSDDAVALEELRTRYSPLMAESRHADTFRVLTHEVEPSKTAFRNLASAIAGISDLEAFMASYRARVAKEGLSAIN